MTKFTQHYLFTSLRLGFRPWQLSDIDAFAAMNADPEVMAYFPSPIKREESLSFLHRLMDYYEKWGFTYFACEILDTKEFIGFVGMAKQDYEAPFNPATDIGWRLKKSAWGKGYATEGALKCMDYAFDTLLLKKIVSVCPKVNTPSEKVMQKIGMTKKGEFLHPKLEGYSRLQNCVWYEKTVQ